MDAASRYIDAAAAEQRIVLIAARAFDHRVFDHRIAVRGESQAAPIIFDAIIVTGKRAGVGFSSDDKQGSFDRERIPPEKAKVCSGINEQLLAVRNRNIADDIHVTRPDRAAEFAAGIQVPAAEFALERADVGLAVGRIGTKAAVIIALAAAAPAGRNAGAGFR